jgi:PBSX family phage terminase large subunit
MSLFKKTEKQREAIPILSSKKYAALYGGSRSGKTFIIIYALIIRAAKTKSRHVIVRRTFASVKRSIFLDTLPKVLSICFPNLPVKWNKTDYFVTLPNGSEIWLAGLDDSRVEKILGMEFSTIYFNESSELDYSSIQVVISRLAQKNELKKKIFFDFNPPDKSHWSYWLFIKGIDPIEDVPLDNYDEYGYLLMNPKDNLENIDEEYLKILEKMPEKDRLRFLNGEFGESSDGQVYYAFSRELHVKPVNKKEGTIFVGLDFNVDPLCGVIFQMIDGKIQVFDELFLNNSDTYKACDELKKRGYGGAKIIPDSTGKNRKTSGQSDFDILRQAGFQIESTHNPFVNDRVNNVNRLFTNDSIIIDSKCKKLIGDLEKVQWKDNKLDQKTDKYLTHISDALGYGCYKLMPFNNLTNLKPFTGRR